MPSALDMNGFFTNMNGGRSHRIALHPVEATPRRGGFTFGVDMIRIVSHVVFMMTATVASASIVDEQFLDEVATIESNMNSAAVGDSGAARGAYQFHAGAWAQANAIAGTEHRFSLAHNWFIARNMARVYLTWLERCIVDAGYKPTKIRLYMAYNMGLSGSLRYAFDNEHPELPASRRRILDRAERIMK